MFVILAYFEIENLSLSGANPGWEKVGNGEVFWG